MTTSTDGAPPSVASEQHDSSGPPAERARRAEREDVDETLDTSSSWLREEMQRRIAEGRSRSGGRHARRDTVTSPGSIGYVPRHSVATPGPGAPRPGPVGGSPSPHAGELLRRERTGAAPTAWSGPTDSPEENGTSDGAAQPAAPVPAPAAPPAQARPPPSRRPRPLPPARSRAASPARTARHRSSPCPIRPWPPTQLLQPRQPPPQRRLHSGGPCPPCSPRRSLPARRRRPPRPRGPERPPLHFIRRPTPPRRPARSSRARPPRS